MRNRLELSAQANWLTAFALLLLTVSTMPNMVHAQNAPAQVVQLPVFGVSIDADGMLQAKMFAEPGGQLFMERARAARLALPPDLFAKSELRKISLARLEKALQRRIDAGQKPTDEMLKLAGLQRVEYVFVFPDQSDIVIAGPAEGWLADAGNRAVGVTTNRPVVLLEDLLVALRLFAPDRAADTWVGCSIDPTREGLEKLNEFNRTIPLSVPTSARDETAFKMAAGMRASLGNAEVKTFGISSTNNLAHVLIEADYRMKLMAIGLEPPPIKMVTFISQLRTAPRTMQRWWFTPNYECVKVTEDRLAMQLVGEGVQLLTEDYQLGADGRLTLKNAKPSGASHLFSQAFTKKYAEIAEASPVFAQLRNMIDVLVLAAYLNKEQLYKKSGWRPSLFLDEKRIPVETREPIKSAPCVANAIWKGSRLIAPAGGGVSIQPQDALTAENLLADKDGHLHDARGATKIAKDAEAWWWD